MKRTLLHRALALFLSMLVIGAMLASCKDGTTTDETTTDEIETGGYEPMTEKNISGYSVVYPKDCEQYVKNVAVDLYSGLKSAHSADLTLANDSNAADEHEILVGSTSRPESEAALALLGDGDYIITLMGKKLVLYAKDEDAYSGMYDYIVSMLLDESFEIANEFVYIGNIERYSLDMMDVGDVITVSDITQISLDYRMSIVDFKETYKTAVGGKLRVDRCHYPTVLELKHQPDEKNNGKLLVSMAVAYSYQNPNTNSCALIMVSSDKGNTWSALACPSLKDSKYYQYDSTGAGSMAHLYELPAQVGDMPAGTLLFAGNVVTNWDQTNGQSLIIIWRSFDCGETWEAYTIVDEAGGIDRGIWEPYLIFSEEDGYLYCFYSDDSDWNHSQKIGYKRSINGIDWEGQDNKIGTDTGKDVEPVDVVARTAYNRRPGMPQITKLGNGKYFLCYEEFGTGEKAFIRYKISDSLADWGDPDAAGRIVRTVDGTILRIAPTCIWVPVGGEDGTIIVASKTGSNDGYMAASTDGGKTWQKIDNPITSSIIEAVEADDRIGYSPSFCLSADGETLYYVNSTNYANFTGKNADVAVRAMAFTRLTLGELD